MIPRQSSAAGRRTRTANSRGDNAGSLSASLSTAPAIVAIEVLFYHNLDTGKPNIAIPNIK